MFHAGAAWSAAHGDDVLRGGNTVGVRLTDDDRVAFVTALRERLPGRVFNVSDTVDPALIETTRQATGYESNAAAGIALATAIIAGFLVAQAVARQSRRESDDREALVALGATRPRPGGCRIDALVGRRGVRGGRERSVRRRRQRARTDRHRPAGTVGTRGLGGLGRAGRRASCRRAARDRRRGRPDRAPGSGPSARCRRRRARAAADRGRRDDGAPRCAPGCRHAHPVGGRRHRRRGRRARRGGRRGRHHQGRDIAPGAVRGGLRRHRRVLRRTRRVARSRGAGVGGGPSRRRRRCPAFRAPRS